MFWEKQASATKHKTALLHRLRISVSMTALTYFYTHRLERLYTAQ